uniref:Uncharacterized protein n=1 Tax=Anopheles dirus TaxID=7168 RepID=A0A182N091_9DIPT
MGSAQCVVPPGGGPGLNKSYRSRARMNPTSLYITTSRLVFQGDIVAGLQDLNRLLPYLRKSLSCAVCCKLLVEPHSPSTGDCQHHICRVCVGKHKKLKPACRFCKGLLQYRENTQLRLLLQCYKSICAFIRSRPVYADICRCATTQPSAGGSGDNGASTSGGYGATPSSLMDLIEEGAAFIDEFKCNSGLSKSAYSILPCIFPPPVVTVASTPALLEAAVPPPPIVAPPPAPAPPPVPCCSKTTNNPKAKQPPAVGDLQQQQPTKRKQTKQQKATEPKQAGASKQQKRKQPKQEQEQKKQKKQKSQKADQQSKQAKQQRKQKQQSNTQQQQCASQNQQQQQQQQQPMPQPQLQQQQHQQPQQDRIMNVSVPGAPVDQQLQTQGMLITIGPQQQEQQLQTPQPVRKQQVLRVLQWEPKERKLQQLQQQQQQQNQQQIQLQHPQQQQSQHQQPPQRVVMQQQLPAKQLQQQVGQVKLLPKPVQTQPELQQSQQLMLSSQQQPSPVQQVQFQQQALLQQQQQQQQPKSAQLLQQPLKQLVQQPQPRPSLPAAQVVPNHKLLLPGATSPRVPSVSQQKYLVPIRPAPTVKQEPVKDQSAFQSFSVQPTQQMIQQLQQQQQATPPPMQTLQPKSIAQVRKQQDAVQLQVGQLRQQQQQLTQQQIPQVMYQQRVPPQPTVKLSQQQQHPLRPTAPGNLVDVVIRPTVSKLSPNVIRNVIPARAGPTIIHAESLASRMSGMSTATVAVPPTTTTSTAAAGGGAVVPGKSAGTLLVPPKVVPAPALHTPPQPIIKNSCVPTTPRIVNITAPQEIKFEAAPIKTVSSGTTMYSVLYAESGNKFTIKRKPDPVSAAKPNAALAAAHQPKLSPASTLASGPAARTVIPVTSPGEHDPLKGTQKVGPQPLQPPLNSPIVVQLRPPGARPIQLPMQQQQQLLQQQQQPSLVQQQSPVPMQLAPMMQQQQYQLPGQQQQQKLATPSQHSVVSLTPQQQQNYRSLIIPQQQQQQSQQQQQHMIQQLPSQPPPTAQQQALKRKGCRCGNATPTPGKLTCCGQRCPCYVDSKSCIDCKCRGCRNPHRADGLKIRRSLSELLQQYNAPATTATATSTSTSSSSTSNAGTMSLGPSAAATTLTLGPNITPVTYSMSALKAGAGDVATATIAGGSAKVKVISAGQHPQALQTTAKGPPATTIVKTGAGGGRTRTNGGVGPCVGVPLANPGTSTITIRPLGSGGSNTTTTTISYLPTNASSGASTYGTATPAYTRTTIIPPTAATMVGRAAVAGRAGPSTLPATPAAITSPTSSTSSSTSTSSSSLPTFWARVGSDPPIRPPSVNKTLVPPERLLATPSPKDADRKGAGLFLGGKPDALLSQSSVAMMPVVASVHAPTATPSVYASVASSAALGGPGVWSPASPGTLFGPGAPVGGPGPTGGDLAALSAYDVNSFVNISHMLDPDGVIDLCEDLELNPDNLLPIE